MTTNVSSFDTQHNDMIHDAQLDFYGKRLATCSSDRTIKIWEVSGTNKTELDTLRGHEGPVWQVAWAHPQFGSLLASCSYDHKVIVWQEDQRGKWAKLYEYTKHESSVNSICWAPYELGLVLACGSSDGSVSVLTYKETEGRWEDVKFEAHTAGTNSVSWAPITAPGALLAEEDAVQPVKKLVSGGCDNLVKVWEFSKETQAWSQEPTVLKEHSDWVRDVAWAPNVGLPFDTIASASQDKRVIIWTREENSAEWVSKVLEFGSVVWRVSWSVTGNILAVSCADNKVTLWKQAVDGEWKCISQMVE